MIDSLKELLESALERRDWIDWQSPGAGDAVRLVHATADGFPGITVDLLGGALLVVAHRREADTRPLIEMLARRFGDDTPVFQKERWSKENAKRAGLQVQGLVCSPVFTIRESGLVFMVDLVKDEHIGFFLDSRPARARVRDIAKNRRVLNLFSYTGAFGVAAVTGGARSTTNVDNKRSALTIARQNYELNQLPFNTRTFMRADAIKHLARAVKGKGRYDLIVLDPPPYSQRPGNRSFKAKTGYARLVARCMEILAPGGLLLSGLNAKGVSDHEFEGMLEEAGLIAKKKLEIMEIIGPGKDFPPGANRPLARFALCAIKRQ
ncbi:MAG: class I SAM-dependent rRNA methyltransferase [Deltaproteobacteria bacterium]|nr:class I SAM-dependent rRNA methyltransferase [Deltaproteobacteria bacterium]